MSGSGDPSLEDIRMQEREKTLQRWENVDELQEEEESSYSGFFDEVDSSGKMENDKALLVAAFDSVSGILEEKFLNRVKAAKFILNLAATGFFGSSGKKRHMHADSIKEVLAITLANKNKTYSFDALSAACFSYRDKTTVMQLGEEVFDEELEKELKLSKDEEFEFRVACSVVIGQVDVGADDSVPICDVNDVFLALGYTMQDSDLVFILDRCEVSSEDSGSVKVDSLLAAFEHFRDVQVPLHKLKTIFNSMVADETLHHNLKSDHKRKAVGSTGLPHVAIRNVLNKTLQLHGSMALDMDATMLVVEEITSRSDRKITLRDFVRIFVTQSEC